MTARKGLDRIPVNVLLRTVQRRLQENENINFTALKARTYLSTEHKKQRLNWCENNSRKTAEERPRVVFTDEKRFVLDGPDDQAKFWRDRRLPRDIFSKRARGGGEGMIWGE